MKYKTQWKDIAVVFLCHVNIWDEIFLFVALDLITWWFSICFAWQNFRKVRTILWKSGKSVSIVSIMISNFKKFAKIKSMIFQFLKHFCTDYLSKNLSIKNLETIRKLNYLRFPNST